MRSEYFGLAGGAFSDTELARLSVLASLVPGDIRAFLRGKSSLDHLGSIVREASVERPDARTQRGVPLRISLRSIHGMLSGHAGIVPEHLRLRDGLPGIWRELERPGAAPYAVTLADAPANIDRQWLGEIFTGIPEVSSAVFETRRPRAGQWNWPLQIGVLPNPTGLSLFQELQSGRYGNLYAPVVLSGENDKVDLLLIPSSLRATEIGSVRQKIAADAILVLGGAELDPRSATLRLRTLLDRYNGGLAGVCFVPKSERMPWLQTVVREMSHNKSLPDGLFEARSAASRQGEGGLAASGDLSAPVILGDREFIRSTKIEESARRLSNVMLGIGQESSTPIAGYGSITEAGEALKRDLESYQWQRESGDATSLVNLMREVEVAVGKAEVTSRLLDLKVSVVGASAGPRPRSSAGTAREFEASMANSGVFRSATVERIQPEADPIFRSPPPKMQSEPSGTIPRHVQAVIRPLVGGARLDSAETPRLAPNTDYSIRVHIGPVKGGDVIAAPEPLKTELLPESEDGHFLNIVFCPLTKTVDGEGNLAIARPTQSLVHLPKVGDSTCADFAFRSGKQPRDFRARVIVSHENRVIQTLMLRSNANDMPEFVPENYYAPNFAPTQSLPADIAFVINDNSEGVSGIATLLKSGASFLEPDGLKTILDKMRDRLSDEIANSVVSKPKLGSARSLKLMRFLAHHGFSILRAIKKDNELGKFDSAFRVHVVEAVNKAYFPVEFLHAGPVPNDDAKLCPNAVEALASNTNEIHEKCAHYKDPDFVCPAAFWGFQKCIERHSPSKDASHAFRLPELGNETLGPIETALLAASNNASEVMKGVKGLPTSVKKIVTNVHHAKSWSQWKDQVLKFSPNIMVLLPHSLDTPDIEGMPALEVSGDNLPSSRLDELMVHPPGGAARGPVVLLLGCSTALADVPFLSFVRTFGESGAPLVIATLAIIHPTQASMVANRLLTEIQDKTRTAVRFDEAMLKVRRELMAGGHEVAFSLVSYGSSSWRI